jgi:hypothetical protein
LPALWLREPHHPKDKEYGYCVRCHVFTGDAEMMPEPRAAELERDFFVATSPEAQAGRPLGDLFIALMTVNLIDLINDGQYISRVVAYKKIEFWQHGNRLGDVDGMRLIAEHYPEIVDAITNQRSNAKTNED